MPVLDLDVHHRAQDLDFAWHCRVRADGQQALVYEMDGRAQSDFSYNRIGLCVLHPPALTAGRGYPAWSRGSPASAGFLPVLVGPQMVLDGRIFSLFPAFDRLEVDATPDLVLAFEFEGDAFEMEDQRNWTDGSFKTYSTPLSLPFPFQAKEGQRFHQRVRVEVRQSKGSTLRARDGGGPAQLPSSCFTGATSTWVPPIGLCLDSDAHVPDEREMCLLRGLAPSSSAPTFWSPGATRRSGSGTLRTLRRRSTSQSSWR